MLEYSRRNWNRFINSRTLRVTINTFYRDFKKDGFFKKTDKSYLTRINMKMTTAGCPVQYEGRINGKWAYYRDRWGTWTLEIFEGKLFESPSIFYKEGRSSDRIGFEAMLFAEDKIMKTATKFTRKFKK